MEAQVIEIVENNAESTQGNAHAEMVRELTSLEMALVGGGNALVTFN